VVGLRKAAADEWLVDTAMCTHSDAQTAVRTGDGDSE
jgi:hypothetical protein